MADAVRFHIGAQYQPNHFVPNSADAFELERRVHLTNSLSLVFLFFVSLVSNIPKEPAFNINLSVETLDTNISLATLSNR